MHFKLSRALTPLLACSIGLISCDDEGTIVQVEPNMEIDPTSVDFGSIQIGTSAQKTVFIRNTGDANLSVSGVAEGSPYDDAFTFNVNEDNAFPVIVPPAGAAFINLTFSPSEERGYEGRLVVRSSDANVGEVEITLNGTGVTTTLEVDPDSLSFGNVVINTSKTLPVTLSNNSGVDARIEFEAGDNVRLCTAGGQSTEVFCALLRDRQIGPDNTFNLRAGESTTLEVQFSPTIAGTRERGGFKLKACASEACEVDIRLDGLGIESGFRCDPANLDFGQVNPGSCLTRTTSCENIANEQVTVVSWSIGPNSSEDFEANAPTVQVLNEGDSVDVDVTYCPDSLGEDAGDLLIDTDNPDPRLRTVVVPLEGTGGGPDIDVLPTTLNFGLVSLIAPSRRTVTIQNVGFADLEVTELVVDAAGTGAYTAPGASGDRLAPGEFLDVTVEFQPTAEGPVQSTLLIRSNDQDENEVEVTLLGEGINLPPCSFAVSPANLGFGVVERGRIASRAFEIRNTGQNDCLVTSARMQPGSDPEFSLPDGDVNSVIIPPSASETIRLEYAPQNLGDNSGNVEFSISSPTSPFNLVPVTGTGADATLLIVPRDLDFGTIGVGCNARARTVTVYNTGSTNARIDSISIPGTASAFTLTSLPAPLPGMPLDLIPGGSFTFDVGFRADAISSYAGAVELVGEFGGQPVTYVVSLQGSGALDATQVDEFEQLGKPKVDILFVIDHTGSMGQEQTALASNFQAFIQFAEAQALDYQLGVTTTDTNDEAGRLVHSNGTDPFGAPASNKIVTPQTLPSPQAVFAQNVAARNLTGGSAADEAGFEAAYLALSNPLIFGHNAGFLRQDAVLSVIFVSDEPEQSPQSADFYINFFLSIKGFRNTNLFSASSIVGDTPGGCSGPGGSASAAPRYLEAANRTGGVFQSICTSDWSRSLEDLSTTAFGFKSRFFLTNQPVISTIEVFIDGVLIPANSPGGTVNWSYDFATNAVNFSPFAVPEPGAQIRIEYTAECL